MKSVYISGISKYIPKHQLNNDQLIRHFNFDSKYVNSELIEKWFGIKTRYFAAKDEQVSDMAYEAALPLLKDHNPDCLIFSAASSDLIEPATSCIIQDKLGLSCPAFDVKNACNSFVNAVQLAYSLICAEQYDTILVVSAEKLSSVIRPFYRDREEFKRSLASLTFGDAAAAVVVSGKGGFMKLKNQLFCTKGEYWHSCSVPGGGSRNYMDTDKYYFEGDPTKLVLPLASVGSDLIKKGLDELGWKSSELKKVITHQISGKTFRGLSSALDFPINKFTNVFHKYGNTGSASIPIAFCESIEMDAYEKGDKILWLGLAAGINISVQLFEWQ
jgi:3-oxoacyl-[acyl-carrier-protein] synthase-3